ncbi:MAG: aminomethyltransferase family protein [Desulforhopalus sp.]
MSADIKTTLLHDWHIENGANMAAFGAYDMPLWYPTGAKGEHLAVLNGAGLFDTSHMAVITIEGKGARALLQHCFSKDLEHCLGIKKTELVAGRSVYGLFLTPDGHVLDDSIVSQVTEDLYMVVVNAGMGGPVAEHLATHSGDKTVKITDLTDRVGKIDLQGKDSAKILSKILQNPEPVFDRFPYFSFKGWYSDDVEAGESVRLSDGTPILLSRTGYTGEFGFEIFVEPAMTTKLWKMVLEAGEEFAICPCGLAARDSLRAGAVLPLSHQDIGDWPFAENPWPFAVADRDAKGEFSKNFIGADALSALKPKNFTLPFAGYDPRKMVVSDKSYVADEAGTKIGTILTCATDMAIGRVDEKIVSVATSVEDGRPEDFVPRGLSCGFVMVDRRLSPGDEVLLTDGKRKIKVEIRSDVRPDRTARRPIKEML